MAGREHTIMRFLSLLISIALLDIGNGLQQTVIGLRARIEGYSDETVGVMMSAYFVGFVLGSLFAPRVIQQVGHIRAFAAFASAISAIALCFVLVISPSAWIVLRIVQGACYAGAVIVVESWLNAATERSARGRVLAVYMVVIYSAWALSQPLVAIASPKGFVLFALVSICLSLSLVPITLSRTGDPGVVSAKRLGLVRLIAISPTALVGSFVLGAVVAAFFGMGPVVGQSAGLSDAEIGVLLSAPLVGALVFQWPLGWLSDMMDRRYIILGGSLAAALFSMLLAGSLGVSPMPFVLVLCFLLGGAIMPLYSVCLAEANDRIDESELIAAAGGFVLIYGVGSAAGPVTASLVMGQVGASGLFFAMTAVLMAFALFGALRIRRRKKTAAADKQSYVATPSTSHAALPLHRHGTGEAEGKKAPQ
ncbi:MFS transporter [Martelella sp. FLE1502]